LSLLRDRGARLRALLLTILALLAAVALPMPAAPAQQPALDGGARVVMYHRFGDGRYPSTNIALEQFEAHLAELSKDKYTVLPLPEIVAALESGEPLPEYAVAITVDDAYRSFWEEAVPRLRERGFPFTLFVATEPVGRDSDDFMTWDQLRELAAMELATIGSQTHSHPHMPAQSQAENLEELRTSQEIFEDRLGTAPELLAYPYGEYALSVQAAAREAGFVAGFGQHSGVIGRTSDRFALPSFPLNESFGDLERFRLAVNALPLPTRDVVPEDARLAPADNPPNYGFTVAGDVGSLERLTCFASGRGKVAVQTIADRRVEVRLDKPFPPGRARINCTMPGPDNRWRWFGRQFYVVGGDAGGD
jgi:peptidoglycan/xylan/chitin deacetylase (PgdA/CDA1 family)